MMIRSAITVLVAIAWISTQVAMGFAHGTTAHDHHDVKSHQTSADHTHSHKNSDHHDTATTDAHDHIQKQIENYSDLTALSVCDTSCAAILDNGLLLNGPALRDNVGDLSIAAKHEFVDLTTPPPNFIL